jgi:hypothetical protein
VVKKVLEGLIPELLVARFLLVTTALLVAAGGVRA